MLKDATFKRVLESHNYGNVNIYTCQCMSRGEWKIFSTILNIDTCES